MSHTITPFADTHSAMKMWPTLAPLGRVLHIRDGETLFYYDTGDPAAPGTDGAGSGAAEAGGTKPSLLLIHGLGDEADSWRHLIPRLSAAGFRVLAPDLPGFGRSAAAGRISRGGHAAAALRLLEAAGSAVPGNPAVLIGSSMGAVIACEAARRRPDLVGGLILLDGCFPAALPPNSGLLLSALPVIGKKWYRAFRTNHEGAWRSLFGYYADMEGMPAEDRRFLRERVIARVESPAQERAYFASLRSLILGSFSAVRPMTRAMAAFPGRVLILWGEADHVLPAASADRIRALRPDAVFTIIPGAGHLPQQEKPAETAETILSFLASAAAGR
ncbi:MAG: alpha/beta hydrolase [Spirochaetaceae bacterium]|jgi:pimeloyl-ACP methyl ester carboxylesterase|nr:alpha/beta hydrolase [Spirochaetaceae bacterium]